MDVDTVLLSRIQFAFTVGFHILFPTLTIGLASFLAVLEWRWLRSDQIVYFQLYRFWLKIFALAFGMGVVSGIVLSYEFGTNFAPFSDATGPVLGPLLSYEVLTAFFLEAGFLGIMLFGLNRVGRKLHFTATLMVAIGTVISSFWILSANSWMHTPDGFEMVDGRFHVTDWWAVVFNPSFPYRLVHMVLASYLTTAFVVAGVSAWFLLKKRHVHFARSSYGMALAMAIVLSPLQVFVGDLHGLNVQEHQPMKVAAMEGLWETREGAPLVLFAWPDQKAETNRYAIEIPYGASLILKHDPNGKVLGLNEVAPEDRPNVPIVFFSFRIMVGLGFLFLLVSLWAFVRLLTKKLNDDRLLMRVCVALTPLGFVATIAGWVVAEVGRQPWVVHGLMRTADAVSPIPVGSVATSLALFVAVYCVLFVVFLHYLRVVIDRGPTDAEPKAVRKHAPLGATQVPAE